MFKYIGLILKFNNVADVYAQEKGQGKPWWLSRTFIGSVIAFLSTAATVFFGIQVSDGQIDVMVNSISTIIPAVIALYGVIMTFVGQAKKKDTPCQTEPKPPTP